MWRLWEAGDRKGAMAAVPDEIADGFYLSGTGDEVKARIDRYFEAGVDSVIIGLLEGAVDPREAARSIAPIRGIQGS